MRLQGDTHLSTERFVSLGAEEFSGGFAVHGGQVSAG
jgi:hypothetical protein